MLELDKPFEFRMYFFVPYNIMPIQHGIQAGHCVEEYGDKYRDDIVYMEYRKHKTWIILNGGTTNKRRDFHGVVLGTLNQIGDSLLENDINFAYFEEPDLNDALTAVCFICDERVWDYENYPDFVNYLINKLYNGTASAESVVRLKMMPYEKLIEHYEKEFNEWVEFLGGKKNLFLRELIKGKKKA